MTEIAFSELDYRAALAYRRQQRAMTPIQVMQHLALDQEVWVLAPERGDLLEDGE